MDPLQAPSSGLKASANRLANSALGLMRTRLELASVELAEELERLHTRLTLMIAGVLLILFGVLGVCVSLVIYFWESYRFLAILLPTIVCSAVGWILLHRSQSLDRDNGLPFAATIAEFDKDREALFRSTARNEPNEEARP
jgi:uncharacterized membrane protein YqjE